MALMHYAHRPGKEKAEAHDGDFTSCRKCGQAKPKEEGSLEPKWLRS